MEQRQVAKPRQSVSVFVPIEHFSRVRVILVNIIYHEKKKKTIPFNYFATTNPQGTGLFLEQDKKNKAVRLSAEDEEIFLSQAKISVLSSSLPASLSQPHAGTEDTDVPKMAHGNEPVALLIAEHHFSEKVSPSSFQGDFCCG